MGREGEQRVGREGSERGAAHAFAASWQCCTGWERACQQRPAIAAEEALQRKRRQRNQQQRGVAAASSGISNQPHRTWRPAARARRREQPLLRQRPLVLRQQPPFAIHGDVRQRLRLHRGAARVRRGQVCRRRCAAAARGACCCCGRLGALPLVVAHLLLCFDHVDVVRELVDCSTRGEQRG